jgi:hypothetical protein
VQSQIKEVVSRIRAEKSYPQEVRHGQVG